MSVYRTVPQREKEAARVLVYEAIDRATTSSSAVALFTLVTAPVHRADRRVDALSLADVQNVELDIKKIQRVQEGGGAVPAVRFINTTVGPELDTGRIVIVTRSDRIELSDNYVAHIDAVEWLGKIRLFLRDSGWRPQDERASSDEEEDDSSVTAETAS